MNKICYGCGVKLQNSCESDIGYTPKEDALYCARCFKMTHYGDFNTSATPKDIKEIVNKINKDNKYVIFLVDFLNVNKCVIDIFKSIKCEKVLVINKCELMPKHINKNKFMDYIKSYYNISDTIKLKGGSKLNGATSIKNFLQSVNIKCSYILGISNSGKSTLINDLITIFNSKISKITVSKRENTTLDFIRVKLSDELTLIDSPGFIIDKYLIKEVTNKPISTFTYNMKDNETISLYDKYYFKFINSTPITFYLSSVKKDLKKIYKDVLMPYEIEVDDNQDVYIYGIGFIHIKKKTKIRTSIDPEYIEIRPSMIGGKYE